MVAWENGNWHSRVLDSSYIHRWLASVSHVLSGGMLWFG